MVYKVECTCENMHYYIGDRKRHLCIRIDEHKSNIKLKQFKWGLSSHCINNNCSINDTLSVLKQETIYTSRMYYEVYFLKFIYSNK